MNIFESSLLVSALRKITDITNPFRFDGIALFYTHPQWILTLDSDSVTISNYQGLALLTCKVGTAITATDIIIQYGFHVDNGIVSITTHNGIIRVGTIPIIQLGLESSRGRISDDMISFLPSYQLGDVLSPTIHGSQNHLSWYFVSIC
jgi:hypothetical protein